MSRLTSVANVKRFLALSSASQDALIGSLIPTESGAVERYTGRHFGFAAATSKRLNGTGTASLVLPDRPIVSVSGLTVNGVVIEPSADGLVAGYVFDENAVFLIGGAKFPAGVQNVAAVWSSGYQATENVTVPAGNTPTIAPDFYGFAMTANAVSFTANAVALALSTSANGPLAGEYSFAEGIFTFNASNANAAVTLVYSYAPAEVQQAVIELVGADMRQRDNLGIKSKSLAGETVSYSSAGMSVGVKQMLQSYRRKVPA